MGVKISNDELALLSTAIAVIRKDAERRRGFAWCADGKLRKFSQEQAVDLIDRLTQLAGHEAGAIKKDALEVAKEVQHGR